MRMALIAPADGTSGCALERVRASGRSHLAGDVPPVEPWAFERNPAVVVYLVDLVACRPDSVVVTVTPLPPLVASSAIVAKPVVRLGDENLLDHVGRLIQSKGGGLVQLPLYRHLYLLPEKTPCHRRPPGLSLRMPESISLPIIPEWRRDTRSKRTQTCLTGSRKAFSNRGEQGDARSSRGA